MLHHDLNQDIRQACYTIMQAHQALPGAGHYWASNIHVVTPYNMPAPQHPSPDSPFFNRGMTVG